MTMITGQSFGQQPEKSEIVAVNGIEMYYEVFGKGEPLLLLHGWTQSSQFWSAYIPTYAQQYKVYAIDLRGHGRTSQLSDDFSIKKAALDVGALLDHLNIKRTKVIGLSYGGLVLLQLAALNPEKMESVVLIGASHRYDGAENTQLEAFSYENLPKEFIAELKGIHRNGDSQIEKLFDQNIDYSIALSDGQIGAIGTNTLIVNGDRDEILGIDHAIALHQKMPSSQLWIVPNTGHIAITGQNQKAFLQKSIEFLNEID